MTSGSSPYLQRCPALTSMMRRLGARVAAPSLSLSLCSLSLSLSLSLWVGGARGGVKPGHGVLRLQARVAAVPGRAVRLHLLLCKLSGQLPRRRHFGHSGPYWGRQYVFWHGRRPLTLIHEVFSPTLQRFLGPLSPDP